LNNNRERPGVAAAYQAAQAARRRISSKHSSVILDNALRLATATSIGDRVAADSATNTLRELLG
jgi:hypothetical protein